VGVQFPLETDGTCGAVTGMVVGSAVRALPSDSAGLCVRLWTLPWGPVWIVWVPCLKRLEQIGIIHDNLIVIANDVYF
jgi:hypothetical protein